MFDTVCHVTSELNHSFSIPSLIFLVLKFVSSIGNIFAFVFFGIMHSNSALSKLSFIGMFLTLIDWIKIFLILSTAEMPINEVKSFCPYTRFEKKLINDSSTVV